MLRELEPTSGCAQRLGWGHQLYAVRGAGEACGQRELKSDDPQCTDEIA